MSLRVSDDDYGALLGRTGKAARATISPPVKKPNKYNAKKVRLDGRTFDSKGEAARYSELRLQERAGVITDLSLQEEWHLYVNDVPVTTYRADFQYYESGKLVLEDFKGVRTDVYKLKKKLIKAICGIDVRETSKPR